jgi:hypothetical protein
VYVARPDAGRSCRSDRMEPFRALVSPVTAGHAWLYRWLTMAMAYQPGTAQVRPEPGDFHGCDGPM